MARDVANKPGSDHANPAHVTADAHGQRSFLEDLSPSRLPSAVSHGTIARPEPPTADGPPRQVSTLAPPHSAPRQKPAQSTKSSAPSPNAGHRQRLRERFIKTGPEGLPDYELLELVLFRVNRIRDTKPLAKELIALFGSFAEVISAPEQRLSEVKGVDAATITEFRILQATSLRLAKGEFARKDLLSSWDQVLTYLRLAQAYADREHFRILFLDKKNVLIADELQGSGTVDHTPVYVREVVKRALMLSASAVIIVHNHPSGDPTPSRADIDMTKLIVETLRPLGIAVHDHVIVGRQGHASLKAMRLM